LLTYVTEYVRLEQPYGRCWKEERRQVRSV
jgi:hypothetical protein